MMVVRRTAEAREQYGEGTYTKMVCGGGGMEVGKGGGGWGGVENWRVELG